jgi:hypothetical protein
MELIVGMREYLVSPALFLLRQDSMSSKALGKLPEGTTLHTLSDVRLERVLDSAVAGVLAGGTLSGFLRMSPFRLLFLLTSSINYLSASTCVRSFFLISLLVHCADSQVERRQYPELVLPQESSPPSSNSP